MSKAATGRLWSWGNCCKEDTHQVSVSTPRIGFYTNHLTSPALKTKPPERKRNQGRGDLQFLALDLKEGKLDRTAMPS